MPGVEMEAKLAFVEFPLASTDLEVSARRAVDWLITQAGASQAMVAVTDPLSGQILSVAEHGIPASAAADFAVSRDDEAHPMARAVVKLEASYFDRAPSVSPVP